MIPDDAEIVQVIIGVEVNYTDSDDPYTRGFGLAPYNRADLSRYLEINLGSPGTFGAFLIGTGTPAFFVPGFHTIPVPKATRFKVHLNHKELSIDNVHNLSVALLGVNEAITVFDRVSLINATVIYRIPNVSKPGKSNPRR